MILYHVLGAFVIADSIATPSWQDILDLGHRLLVPYWPQISGVVANEPLDPSVLHEPLVDVGKASVKGLTLVFDLRSLIAV